MTNQSIEGYLIFRDTQLDSGRTVRPLVPLVPSKGPQVTPGTIVPRCSTCIAKRQRTSAVDLSWSIVIPSFFRGGNSAATIAKAEGSLFMATCQVSHATSHKPPRVARHCWPSVAGNVQQKRDASVPDETEGSQPCVHLTLGGLPNPDCFRQRKGRMLCSDGACWCHYDHNVSMRIPGS